MTPAEFRARQRITLNTMRDTYKKFKADFESPEYQKMVEMYHAHDPIMCAMTVRHDQNRMLNMEESIAYLVRKLECS
jgi:hypothetical protein